MKYAIIKNSNNLKALLVLTAALVLMTGCAGSSAQKSSGMASTGPLVIPDDTSCGVCGMYPARYPQWHSQIIFTDGTMVPFDGCKDMFKYLLKMSKFDKNHHTRKDVAAIWVKDFGNGSWFDGEKATYVVASNKMGPMGKELIPFQSGNDAEKFQAENGGTIHPFSAINIEMVHKLGMGGMKMEGHMDKSHMGKNHMGEGSM